MIRFVFRFVGLLCLALGFIFLVYDGTRLIADQMFDRDKLTTVEFVWSNVHQNSLAALQSWAEKIVGPAPWRDIVTPYVLKLPIWAALGIVGALLILLGRKKR